MLLFTASAAALGAVLGLPAKRAVAASPQMTLRPGVNRPPAQLEVIQPRFVSPSAVNLLRIADQALSNEALAERIFHDPDGVAAQFHLSDSERLVLRHMDQAQFQAARGDAARLVTTRRLPARACRPAPPTAA